MLVIFLANEGGGKTTDFCFRDKGNYVRPIADWMELRKYNISSASKIQHLK